MVFVDYALLALMIIICFGAAGRLEVAIAGLGGALTAYLVNLPSEELIPIS